MNPPVDMVSIMQYDVKALTYADPRGKVVASFPSKEQAEEARELMNSTTPPSLLTFFIVTPKEKHV